jgi:hypothetical protein
VPRLPRKVKIDIAKCHACHANRAAAPSVTPENQARHQSQPSAISATQSAVKGMPTFEISSPTWVSDKDVVLNKPKQVYKSNQSIPMLSHFYNTHTHKQQEDDVSALAAIFLIDVLFP